MSSSEMKMNIMRAAQKKAKNTRKKVKPKINKT